MSTRWRTSRWLPGRGVCGGSGGGPAAPAGDPLSVDLVKITPGPLELGAELPASLQFNAFEFDAAGALILRQIQDDQGNGPVDILGQANPVPTLGMGVVYTKTGIGEQVQFTYTADDGSNVAQDTEAYTWLPRVYFGVDAIPGAINEAFVEALTDSELRADKGITRNGVTWTAGEYLWVAFPQAFNPTSPLDFLVTIGGGGFPGGFILAQAGVSVTPNTPNGLPILYDVWRSTGSGTGLVVDVAVSP